LQPDPSPFSFLAMVMTDTRVMDCGVRLGELTKLQEPQLMSNTFMDDKCTKLQEGIVMNTKIIKQLTQKLNARKLQKKKTQLLHQRMQDEEERISLLEDQLSDRDSQVYDEELIKVKTHKKEICLEKIQIETTAQELQNMKKTVDTNSERFDIHSSDLNRRICNLNSEVLKYNYDGFRHKEDRQIRENKYDDAKRQIDNDWHKLINEPWLEKASSTASTTTIATATATTTTTTATTTTTTTTATAAAMTAMETIPIITGEKYEGDIFTANVPDTTFISTSTSDIDLDPIELFQNIELNLSNQNIKCGPNCCLIL